MSQGWNRQFQNVQRLIDEYANMINLRDQGFQLGESGNLRRPGNFNLGEAGPMKTGKTVPTVYQQPRVQPQAMLPGGKTPLLTTSGKPLPKMQPQGSMPSQGQIAYKLPNGTYTSNPDLVNIANKQMAKAAITKGAKTGGITAAVSVPTAILTHRKAIDYYNNILNDPNSTPEQKQLAMAMRTKEQIQMGTEGLGTAIGTGLGTLATKHPRIGSTIGGVIPNALSQGVGWAFDKGLTPAMQQHEFQPYNGSLINEVSSIISSMGNGKKSKSSGNSGSSGGSTGTNGSRGTRGMGDQANTQAQALALSQQLGGNPPIVNQQDADTQQANVNAINDYVSKLQEINQPYIESLQRFADNYGDLYNQNQLYNRRMRDLSAITGSPLWYQSAKDYNPLEVEATKIDLQKKIQEAQAGDLNAINEIMGNLAMAQEMGLPPEAAFANKNLLTMMAARDREANKYQIALENNLMKKYGIDRNYARALTVQAMRGQNALDVASMYTGAYGNGGGVAPGLNQQGTANNVAGMDAILQAAHNKNNR